MDTQLANFEFDGQQVRTITDENGETWFVGNDIANLLGYSRPSKAIADLVPEKHIRGHRISAPSGCQVMKVINEAGLYRLIFKSRQKRAELFIDWVASEVLPTIRKTGGYGVQNKILAELYQKENLRKDLAAKRYQINRQIQYVDMQIEDLKNTLFSPLQLETSEVPVNQLSLFPED
ncbi:MAG: BRO family protein [Carboxylicivirga sp.]|jgi:anti-repressor protein|nr:BRO family protein [Carboxylicivirga sp.]